MERLTKWDGNHASHWDCQGSCENCNGCCGYCSTMVDRLAAIEDILGDEYDLNRLEVILGQRMSMREEVSERFSMTSHIPLDRLRVLVDADQEGRCIIFPCKVGDTAEIHGGRSMKIVLDEGARMPTRAYEHDGGLDLYARETQIVPAKESAVFDTGVHIELPIGTVGELKSKSGLNINHGLLSDGLIDPGYTGSIKVKLYNLSGYDYAVRAGDKISQLVICPVMHLPLEQVEALEDTERGSAGFGSSGR